jgi:succinoglycan biosynthesis transport protein ExoP
VNLRDYGQIVRDRWRLVTACLFIGVVVASLVTITATKTYEAKTQLFVSVQTGDSDVTAANQGNTFTQQRVTSYAAIVDSPLTLEPVAAQLGLTTSEAAGLASAVSAGVPLDTTLINVSVVDESAAEAARIANAVGSQFASVITDLEKGEQADRSLVKVTVVRQAEVPTAPISPRPSLNLALGLLLGLAVGIGAAVLRETLDTSVKDADDVARLDGAPVPVIGAIGYDSDAARSPLIVHADPHSPRAEAFRQLRTNLQFLDVDNPPRSIVVTSSVPAEGKSTTAANLALAMAQAGMRVALVEADLRRPKVAAYLGLENAAGLTTVLIGRAKVEDVLQQWGTIPLQVLPSGPIAPNPSELLGSHQMLTVLRKLEDEFDVVVLDAPPLLPVTDAAVLAGLAGGAVIVVRTGKTKREQVARAIENLRGVDARVLGVLLNMTPARGGLYDYEAHGSYAPVPVAEPTGRGSRFRQN